MSKVLLKISDNYFAIHGKPWDKDVKVYVQSTQMNEFGKIAYTVDVETAKDFQTVEQAESFNKTYNGIFDIVEQ